MDEIQFNIDQITETLQETSKKFAAANTAGVSHEDKAYEFACIIGTLQAQLEITRRDLKKMKQKKFWQFWK